MSMADWNSRAGLRLAATGAACALGLVSAGVGTAAGSAESYGACVKSSRCRKLTREDARRLCVKYVFRVVAADKHAEILFVTFRHSKERPVPIHGIYARWRPTGRVTLLEDNAFGISQAETAALAGRYIAFEKSVPLHCYSPGCSERKIVHRLDIKTGRQATTRIGVPATALELTPLGSAAWTEPSLCKESPGSPGQSCEGYSVVVARASGAGFAPQEVLATSTTIEPRSLALADGHLYWTEDGQPREATIE